MKKNLIVLCAFLVICVSGFADEPKRWINIIDDDTKIISFDIQTITTNEQGNILVWEKLIMKQSNPNLKVGKKLIYKTLFLNEYKKGFRRSKSITFFDKKGTILASETSDSEWDVILPDTWEEQIYPIYYSIIDKKIKK